MSSFNGAIPTPTYFDAMDVLWLAVGPDDDRYKFWYGVVGRSLGRQLIDMNVLCGQNELTYPEMTQQNINALGLKEIFRLWMLHYFQSQYRNP